jgi:6-pyruvoyl-tetrahydropterin synthase
MNQFANALGKSFNKDTLRIRSFDMGGHTFKVKVPLTAEYENMLEVVKIIDDNKVNQYYDDLSKEFINNKSEFEKQEDVVFTDNDILLKGTSLRETAKNKAILENRILSLIKLIVPEEDGFDMSTITYDMVEELFPFSVQIQLIEEISLVISPSYKTVRGKS